MSWFQSWFDTHYYHLLYGHRDEQEAEDFIDKVVKHLNTEPGQFALDLACGKGRHSKSLASRGLVVTGIDLSEASISHAREHIGEAEFFTHDMRRLFRTNYYDFIFNLFTSFGYFEKRSDDLSVLKQVNAGLKAGGLFVMDYINAEPVLDGLPSIGEKHVEGISFSWEKKLVGRQIVKEIVVKDNEQVHHFHEKVRVLSKDDLISLFEEAGLKVKAVFGNYQLKPYSPATSPRIIFLAEKTIL